jgi:hypothetical protein
VSHIHFIGDPIIGIQSLHCSSGVNSLFVIQLNGSLLGILCNARLVRGSICSGGMP